MMTQAQELHTLRVKAAELSGGISSDVIYSAIERVIAARNLTGDVLDYGARIGDFSRRSAWAFCAGFASATT
jgi:hypothetical protein